MRLLYDKTRLEDPTKQIRLLQYQPQDTTCEDNPHYSLLAYDLDQGWPEYIAISYTWGDKQPTLPLTVNGHVMRVGFNCWHGLWQLRHHQIFGLFWMDLLCIDQENDDEKSAQVRMMGPIFEKAESVAACIGAGDVLGRLHTLSTTGDIENLDEIHEELEFTPYFNRLWIKQEIILAKSIRLYCGLQTLQWEELETAMEMSKQVKEQGPQYDDWQKLVDLGNLLSHRRRSSALKGPSPERAIEQDSLFELLQRYGDARCADARDKVYALLSLLPGDDIAHQHLQVNYAQSAFNLFRQILALCFQDISPWYRANRSETLSNILDWLGLGKTTPEICLYLEARSHSGLELLESASLKSASTFPTPTLKVQHAEFNIVSITFLNDPDEAERMDEVFPDIPRVHWSSLKRIKPILPLYFGLLSSATTMQDLVRDSNADSKFIKPDGMGKIEFEPIKVVVKRANHRVEPRESSAFLVPADTRSGDIIAEISWGDSQVEDFYTKDMKATWQCSHAVLRRSDTTSQFRLKSWAIPKPNANGYNPKYSLSLPIQSPSSAPLGTLRLGYEDVLTFLLLEKDCPRSLSTTSVVGNSYAIFKKDVSALREREKIAIQEDCRRYWYRPNLSKFMVMDY